MDFWKLFEAWLVAEENHLYVLGVYGLIFGIMLPAAVGSWWYRSIQYTGDSVLIKTTKMFEVRFYNCNLEIYFHKKVWSYFFLEIESNFAPTGGQWTS